MTLTRRTVLATGAALAADVALGQDAARKEPKMITRPIPKTGEQLPVIGMGTWQTFDVGSGAEERRPLGEVLTKFFAAGAKLIDSSPMYGKAEGVVGELLAAQKQHAAAFLATKVWTSGKAEGEAQMKESLRRLQIQKIDLMQVHNLVDVETHLETLRGWKEQGRTRYVGVTHYALSSFDALEKWVRSGKVDFVQLPYSVGVREAEKRLLPAAKDSGVAVIVMRPFEGGTLFSKARSTPLPPVARELGATSWAQLFLKFIVAHPAVTCAIPATSNPKHVVDNLGALTGSLPDEKQRTQLLRHLGL